MTNHQIKVLLSLVCIVTLTPLSAMGGVLKRIPESLDEVDVIIAGGE